MSGASPTLVVGDVHGCLAELDALLALAPGRAVVFVGDLVAKGPSSGGVVARARSLGARAVMGNHDLRTLDVRDRLDRGKSPGDARAAHVTAARDLSVEDVTWLRALPYFLRLPTHDAIVVHAGLVPGVSLDEQSSRDLVSMRSIGPDGTASSRFHDGVPWASRWAGPELVLFGHDAVRGLQRWPFAIGLDTGCVYGGSLSAMLLPEREIVSVRAERAWLPVE